MTQFKVPYIDLLTEFKKYEHTLTARFRDVCSRGQYILRDEVHELENKLAQYLDCRHAIGVGSGSDALVLALKTLGIGPGDQVITVAHTFVATISAIHSCGAEPVLVDIGSDHNLAPSQLEAAITATTKCVLVVHMNGHCCDMDPIIGICDRYGLEIIEDAAQAFGSRYRTRYAGTFGRLGCFSFHPMKVFHALGDGGLVTTNDDALAEKIKRLRNHGQDANKNVLEFGVNSRLDNLQAGFLLDFLPELDTWITRRREIAACYHHNLSSIPEIIHPPFSEDINHHFDVCSSYVLRTCQRDALKQHLVEDGIEVFTHWDPPLHKNPALQLGHWELPETCRLSAEALSLPIHVGLTDDQINYVIKSVKAFYE